MACLTRGSTHRQFSVSFHFNLRLTIRIMVIINIDSEPKIGPNKKQAPQVLWLLNQLHLTLLPLLYSVCNSLALWNFSKLSRSSLEAL